MRNKEIKGISLAHHQILQNLLERQQIKPIVTEIAAITSDIKL